MINELTTLSKNDSSVKRLTSRFVSHIALDARSNCVGVSGGVTTVEVDMMKP